LTGRFHRHSAAGWAECTVAGPGRVRRHAAQFSERSSTSLIGHARVALSGVLTRLPSTLTDDTQRGGKGHKLLPAPWNAMAHRKVSKGNRWEEIKGDGTRCVLRTSSPRVGFPPTPSPPQKKTNKHWKRRKESLKTVRWIKAPVDKVEDNRRWPTRRAERAPGTPFSWATCDKMKVAALP